MSAAQGLDGIAGTVAAASAAKYAAADVVAMYLHAEWGDRLTPRVPHVPGGLAGLGDGVDPHPGRDGRGSDGGPGGPGHFYRRAADLAAGWLAGRGAEPLTACDVGAGTGRFAYELARRLTTLAELTVVEPSEAFCAWIRRLLVDPPRDLVVPTPGRVGAPRQVPVAAGRLPRMPLPLRVRAADVAAVAAGRERFDLVTCFNVLDRVADPAAFTAELCSLVAPGGLLVMACPFDFDEAYTPPQAWVGDLREVIPAADFEVVGVADLAYSFRQYDRRFNWYLSQVVAAARR